MAITEMRSKELHRLEYIVALDAENAQRHKDDEVNDYTVRLVIKITDKRRK